MPRKVKFEIVINHPHAYIRHTKMNLVCGTLSMYEGRLWFKPANSYQFTYDDLQEIAKVMEQFIIDGSVTLL